MRSGILLLNPKSLVEERGFEPPTPWSRTRFQQLLNCIELCRPQVIDVARVAVSVGGLLISAALLCFDRYKIVYSFGECVQFFAKHTGDGSSVILVSFEEIVLAFVRKAGSSSGVGQSDSAFSISCMALFAAIPARERRTGINDL
jgi:hypothetical protein